jgi:4-aminobutyrate aminotransferase-like enzyme
VEELINPAVFPPGSTHSTFACNPLGTAAGLAVMEYIKSQDLDITIPEKGAYLLSKLRELQGSYKVIGDIDGLGLAIRIEMTRSDGFTPDRELTNRIFQEAMKGNLELDGQRYGLVLDVGGYYKNVFTLAPALTINYEEMDLFARLFEVLLKRCTV